MSPGGAGTRRSHRWLALLSPAPCLGKCVQGSRNNDHSGHEKALSCCVNNYLCRHAPSLRKKPELSSSVGIYIRLLMDAIFGFLFSPYVGSSCIICVQTSKSYQLLKLQYCITVMLLCDSSELGPGPRKD